MNIFKVLQTLLIFLFFFLLHIYFPPKKFMTFFIFQIFFVCKTSILFSKIDSFFSKYFIKTISFSFLKYCIIVETFFLLLGEPLEKQLGLNYVILIIFKPPSRNHFILINNHFSIKSNVMFNLDFCFTQNYNSILMIYNFNSQKITFLFYKSHNIPHISQ